MKHSARPSGPRCIAVSVFAGAPSSGGALVEHGTWNLAVALRGGFHLVRASQSVALAPSDIALFRRSGPEGGAFDVAATAGRSALMWASFSGAPSELAVEASTEGIHLPASEVARDPAIQSVVDLLEKEIAHAPAGSSRLVRSLGEALFECVVRCALRAEAPVTASQLVLDGQIARALDHFEAKPGARWTVAALAKAACLSRAQFSRRFAAALGVSPLRYVAARRLELAVELLMDGDRSLAEIAARVGYESEFAFSRAFKRHMGEAPGAFRRRMRARPGVTLALAA